MMEFFSGFKKGMKHFGNCLTIIINSILLLVVYAIGVGITSLVAKLVRKHFLNTKPTKEKTYWTDLNLNKKAKAEHYKQF